MSRYRPVDVRIWNDRKFLSLSTDARMLWVFLLTTPISLPIPGVVVGGDGAIADQLGLDPEGLGELFGELFGKGLSIRRQGRLIWLPNALKYQPPQNPNQIKGWSKTWEDIPECELKAEIWHALKIACDSWSKQFRELFREPLPEQFAKPEGKQFSQDQEQKQEQEQEEKNLSATSADGTRRQRRNRGSADDIALRQSYVRCVDAFCAQYAAKFGGKATWGAKQGANLNRLLKQHGELEFMRRLDNAFTSPPHWLTDMDFGTFVQHFDKFVQAHRPGGTAAHPAQTALEMQLERVRQLEAEEQAQHTEES